MTNHRKSGTSAVASEVEYVVASYDTCGCIASLHVERWDPSEWITEELKVGMTIKRVPMEQARAEWRARVPEWGKCIHRQAVQGSLL